MDAKRMLRVALLAAVLPAPPTGAATLCAETGTSVDTDPPVKKAGKVKPLR